MSPNLIWSIAMAVNAAVVFILAYRAVKKARLEGLIEGYEQCIADSTKNILSTKTNEKDATYNDAVEAFNEWMETGFADNELGIEWGTYPLDGDRTVLFVKAFGETIIEVKEVKDGDTVNE